MIALRPVAIGLLLALSLAAAPAASHGTKPAPATAASALPSAAASLTELSMKLEAEPERVDLLVQRARLYRMRHDYGGALADLNLAYETAPDDAALSLERGLVLLALGAPRAALSDLEYVASLTDDASPAELRRRAGEAELGRGHAWLLLKRPQDARAALLRAHELAPSVEVILALGALEEQRGDMAQAAAAYALGMEELGDVLALRLALVRAHGAQRDYSRALAMVDALLANPAFQAEALAELAELSEQAKDDNKRRKAWREAIDELPPPMLHRMSRRGVSWQLYALADDDGDQDDDSDMPSPQQLRRDLDALRQR